jgi:hypothetical protein
VIVFATSDKGGTGRSVTSCNIAYQASLRGADVAYVDFDFGSPTAGAVLGVEQWERGTPSGRGMHSFLRGKTVAPDSWDLWVPRAGVSLYKPRDASPGRLVLFPGDAGGDEFAADKVIIKRCGEFFQELESEFALSIVDLSAGRSYAIRMALEATGRQSRIPSRWLVFHRWTRQHVVAAHGLVYGEHGLLDIAVKVGHDREELLDRLRFIRTAVIQAEAWDRAQPAAPSSEPLSLRSAARRGAELRSPQEIWFHERRANLNRLAGELRVGRTMLLGEVPLDPVLQWHEQLLTDRETSARVANHATVDAFVALAERVLDPLPWERT